MRGAPPYLKLPTTCPPVSSPPQPVPGASRCAGLGGGARGPSWLPVMITMKVTVQPLPHHHSLGTFYGMGLGGGSRAFSWTCAVPPREVGLAQEEGRSQRSSCSFQASTWLVATAVGSQGRVRGLPDPWPVQSHPELWSCWGRVPTPGHSSGQDTHTWVAKGPGYRERGRGPGERGVQGRGVGASPSLSLLAGRLSQGFREIQGLR